MSKSSAKKGKKKNDDEYIFEISTPNKFRGGKRNLENKEDQLITHSDDQPVIFPEIEELAKLEDEDVEPSKERKVMSLSLPSSSLPPESSSTSGDKWTKEEKMYLIESWANEWKAYNVKGISNQRKSEIWKRIVDRHNRRYKRTKPAIDDMWRDLLHQYRATKRAKNHTGDHTPSPKDLDIDLYNAINEFMQGDPTVEPVFELDALGSVTGGGVKLEDKDDDGDDGGESKGKKKKQRPNSVIEEVAIETASYLKESLQERKKMMAILEQSSEAMKKNSDTLEKLVNFFVNNSK